jgi:nickel/cobalt exporter
MRRAALLTALTLAALLAPAAAQAHPLGNFSENHLVVVRVAREGVTLRYVLDQAEIPTFQERGLSPARVLARKRAVVARGVTLTVGGRPVPLALAPGGSISFPMGQGGLHTTRVELELSARVPTRGAVVVRDATYSDRVGWKAVIVLPGAGTAVRADVPSADPTRRLHVYPKAVLSSPADRPVAHLAVEPGPAAGSVTAPRLGDLGATTTDRGGGDRFSSVFARAAAGRGVLLLLLLAAFGWGAVHALSPGHGKAMVAAYLVGARGTSRHAVALGLTVTVTHTIGVFALGLVTLLLSAYVVPEHLYPWLNLVSGLLVLCVGAGVLRARVRRARAAHHHHHHGHRHGHEPPERISARAVLAMGASAGLIPCPSALVVLLGAIAQHQVALGLLLIVAFSLGLAATLTALGLAVVHATRLTARIDVGGRLVAVLPAVSSLAIVGVGAVLTAQAVAKVLQMS